MGRSHPVGRRRLRILLCRPVEGRTRFWTAGNPSTCVQTHAALLGMSASTPDYPHRSAADGRASESRPSNPDGGVLPMGGAAFIDEDGRGADIHAGSVHRLVDLRSSPPTVNVFQKSLRRPRRTERPRGSRYAAWKRFGTRPSRSRTSILSFNRFSMVNCSIMVLVQGRLTI